MRTCSLEFWTEQKDFCIYAEAQDYEKELRLTGQAKQIIAQFESIYEILEEKKHKAGELDTLLRTLSEQLLQPFASQLRSCDLVRFVIDEDLIRCAFDLLLFEGTYLFLQRPVCYQIEEGSGEDAPSIALRYALLIADLTADPEEACLAVSKLIPESEYVEVSQAHVGMVRDAAAEVDALIISAHGEIEADNRGVLYLNDQSLNTNVIDKLEAWIVYFDACQQGANLAYVQAFQEESDVQFYLGPIISNDAGDSSTKTMVWFFTGVMTHKDPIRGLYETRKRLFAHYQEQERLDLVTTLNKAFPFRLYEFVESDEE